MRWRAEEDEEYWYISELGVEPTEDWRNVTDNLRYESGNYFKTRGLAEEALLLIRELLDKFHNHNNTD